MGSLGRKAEKQNAERMSDISFKMMTFLFRVIDFIYPHIKKRVKGFGVQEGMTVVDYGCGPGRYATVFADFVGEEGKVYAIDIHELAIEAVKKRIEKHNLRNIEPVLAEGYNSGLPDNIADMVCAIDMFFGIRNPTEFLKELKRITKSGGVLVIDQGHQPRSVAKEKIVGSGCWDIFEESKDHMKCRPR
ncbi:MAG: methyltransferase domain-containing protein [Dehalococcoidales bacterium]|nr:MAG: methyltransferase domain-containing protein [Dehalococcoidales bacterium]